MIFFRHIVLRAMKSGETFLVIYEYTWLKYQTHPFKEVVRIERSWLLAFTFIKFIETLQFIYIYVYVVVLVIASNTLLAGMRIFKCILFCRGTIVTCNSKLNTMWLSWSGKMIVYSWKSFNTNVCKLKVPSILSSAMIAKHYKFFFFFEVCCLRRSVGITLNWRIN